MALHNGKLVALPQQAIDYLSDVNTAHLKVPKITHGFYRLYTCDWDYLQLAEKVMDLNRHQIPPVTRRDVDSIWYAFVMDEAAEWQVFEQSRLVYHIPAGQLILQKWLDGWSAFKAALRSMSSSEANEFWEEQWHALGRPANYDITAVDFNVPPQHDREIKRREQKVNNAFYSRIRQYLFSEDRRAAQISEAKAMSLEILRVEQFDAHNIGVREVMPLNLKLQTRNMKRKIRIDARRATRYRRRAAKGEEQKTQAEESKKRKTGAAEAGVLDEVRDLDKIVEASVKEVMATIHSEDTKVKMRERHNGTMLDMPIRRKRKADDDEADDDKAGKENVRGKRAAHIMDLPVRGGKQMDENL